MKVVVTLLRALAWLGVGIAGWSVNLRWGADDDAVAVGAPQTWEPHVVGAALLCALAALALSISGRGGEPPRLAYRIAAVVAAGLGLGIALSIYLRVTRDELYEHMAGVVSGPGFAWLATGTLLSFGAALGSLALRRRAPARRAASRRRAHRRT